MNAIVDSAARAALIDGVKAEMDCVAVWCRANVRYQPAQEFFVVFLIACRMGELNRDGA